MKPRQTSQSRKPTNVDETCLFIRTHPELLSFLSASNSLFNGFIESAALNEPMAVGVTAEYLHRFHAWCDRIGLRLLDE